VKILEGIGWFLLKDVRKLGSEEDGRLEDLCPILISD